MAGGIRDWMLMRAHPPPTRPLRDNPMSTSARACGGHALGTRDSQPTLTPHKPTTNKSERGRRTQVDAKKYKTIVSQPCHESQNVISETGAGRGGAASYDMQANPDQKPHCWYKRGKQVAELKSYTDFRNAVILTGPLILPRAAVCVASGAVLCAAIYVQTTASLITSDLKDEHTHSNQSIGKPHTHTHPNPHTRNRNTLKNYNTCTHKNETHTCRYCCASTTTTRGRW